MNVSKKHEKINCFRFVSMKKKNVIIISAASVIAVLLVVGIVFASLWYIDNRRPGFEKEFVLLVYPDTDASRVLDALCEDGCARSRSSLERCFGRIGVVEKMKPGRYPIRTKYPPIYVARMLAYGWQEPTVLTLSGTLRNKGRIAQRIASQMMVDSTSVMNALNDEVFLSDYGFTPENVFALIIPDSYQMYWTASVREIFDRFKKEYDEFWTPERVRLAGAQGLTPMEASVMASIVCGETLKDFEYPLIAGVYLNRFHRGMKLQADPTICFCYDYTLNRVLKKHLSVDSPYNTYKYAGLPPAPINVPSKACIEAVLHPDTNNYLFLCANPDFDGTHRFAATYAEHQRNAREFQRALTARFKAKGAGSK